MTNLQHPAVRQRGRIDLMVHPVVQIPECAAFRRLLFQRRRRRPLWIDFCTPWEARDGLLHTMTERAGQRRHRSIVVVEADPRELSKTINTLQAAGYQVVGASKFEEAKRLLADAPPSLLITGVRLGAYNGLHLIVRSRIDHPEMNAILTNHAPDPVLRAEAERQKATYLVRPWSHQDLLSAIARSLQESTPQAAPTAAE